VPPAVLARYQEHARWQAILSPEFGLDAMLTGAHKTVVRAQEMSIAEPVQRDVELSVAISIAHAGRTSVRFAHHVVQASNQREVARGVATLVLLDLDGKPTPLPERVHGLVQPAACPEVAPATDAAPAESWVQRIQVRPSDLDTLRHVNQSRYIDFCDDARQLAMASGGYGDGDGAAKAPIRTAGRVTAVAIEYVRETVVGHDLDCHTWLLDAAGARVGFELRDAVDGELVSRARFEMA
jgi:acyl-CoA thioesterase FadM